MEITPFSRLFIGKVRFSRVFDTLEHLLIFKGFRGSVRTLSAGVSLVVVVGGIAGSKVDDGVMWTPTSIIYNICISILKISGGDHVFSTKVPGCCQRNELYNFFRFSGGGGRPPVDMYVTWENNFLTTQIRQTQIRHRNFP